MLFASFPLLGRFELYEGLDFYPMNSTPRGKCLIINIIQFTDKSQTERHGSEKDTRKLLLLSDATKSVEINAGGYHPP